MVLVYPLGKKNATIFSWFGKIFQGNFVIFLQKPPNCEHLFFVWEFPRNPAKGVVSGGKGREAPTKNRKTGKNPPAAELSGGGCGGKWRAERRGGGVEGRYAGAARRCDAGALVPRGERCGGAVRGRGSAVWRRGTRGRRGGVAQGRWFRGGERCGGAARGRWFRAKPPGASRGAVSRL